MNNLVCFKLWLFGKIWENEIRDETCVREGQQRERERERECVCVCVNKRERVYRDLGSCFYLIIGRIEKH